jgi:hypothetical protein
MSYWDQLRILVRTLFRTTPSTPPPPDAGPPASLRPRVLLITYSPLIQSEGGRALARVLGWGNADDLCREYIADLRECSKGFVEYEIVEWIEVDAWPVKEDGFVYDGEAFVRNWRNRNGWHQPDLVDYEAIIAEFDLLKRIDAGRIDEVWLFAFPYAGFYESIMVGPDAFWCNAPPIPRDDVSRRFVIMGFNYQRGVGEMLEAYGHRTESILRHTWRHAKGEDNLYERFILYDQKKPGQANVGWMHYAPNSVKDYDWGNKTRVLSNCDDWLNFPNFEGTVRQVDCRDWGNGEIRAHHKWWFDRLPNAPGYTQGIANNWWWYTADPNVVR